MVKRSQPAKIVPGVPLAKPRSTPGFMLLPANAGWGAKWLFRRNGYKKSWVSKALGSVFVDVPSEHNSLHQLQRDFQ
jgi:hypothetical protein